MARLMDDVRCRKGTIVKRLLLACLKSVLPTLATAATMFALMCVFNLIWIQDGPPEPEQTMRGYYFHCMAMASVMIAGQAAGLLVANSIVAFLRGRLRIVRALMSGALLLLLDCLAPAVGVFPHSTEGLSVYLIAFPFLVTAIQWLDA